MSEEKEPVKSVNDINLEGLNTKGFILLKAKADDTEGNRAIHDGFREFCRVETDKNYTQGIRKLLEYYQSDFKYEAMWNKIAELESRIDQLTATAKEEKDEDEDSSTF